MENIDLPCLPWSDFTHHKGVNAAYEYLRRLTDPSGREVSLRSGSYIPDLKTACCIGWSGAYEIFVNKAARLVNYSLVHELLHAILTEEGYCRVWGRFPASHDRLDGMLSNEMQHPEIFRRMMEEYRLDMDDYWAYWDQELGRGLQLLIPKLADTTFAFEAFPELYTWFFFQQASAPHLEAFGEHKPEWVHSAEKAFAETKDCGFSDRTAQRESLEIFKRHWIQCCRDYVLPEWRRENRINCIAESELRPLIDVVKDRTAKDVKRKLKIPPQEFID